jgi:hypothetical protein
MYCHGWKLEKYSSQECVEEKKKVEVSAAVERE